MAVPESAGWQERTQKPVNLTSHEHVGTGGCGALDASLDVFVVTAVAACVIAMGLTQQQCLTVGPGVGALTIS